MTDTSLESVARVAGDYRLTAAVMEEGGIFKTGQGIVWQAADMMEALAAKLAEREAQVTRLLEMQDDQDQKLKDADDENARLRDPAVLAELPEVKALIAAVVEAAAEEAQHASEPWREEDGMAKDTCSRIARKILALIKPDAKAALDRMLQEARNEALGDALGLARGRGQPGVIIYGDPVIEAVYRAIRALIPEVKK